ncbi:hypothetical protein [Allocoleopsis sp.]|uniref:hypothetical protein n=1 Tax=Allocoleopsis sp. TaxID=3088169 RepID=UPI002FD732C0
MQNLPTLTTEETQRLRSDYPCIEHLEAGNVASWLMERQEQLLVRAKDERTGMNIAKLITLTGGVVGAVCYATSPLALIGGTLAGAGYIWAVARDLNDSHQFAPLPFIRGNFIEFLSAMGDKEAREEWFASQNELVDLIFHLNPIERYEFGMLKTFIPNLTDFLSGVEGGKRFYAYRWLLDWYINLKGNLPTQDALNKHLAAVTVDPRVNYQQVSAIQQHQAQMLLPTEPQFVELPQPQFASLPQPQFVEPTGAVGTSTKLNAIETQAEVVTSSDPQSQEMPAVEVESPQPMKKEPIVVALFDFSRLRTEPDKFAHLRIIGGTGVGKTTFVDWLLDVLGGERFVITPKKKSWNWVGLKVYGLWFDYETIRAKLQWIHAEMYRRYPLMSAGQTFELTNFVVDEWRLINTNVKAIRERNAETKQNIEMAPSAKAMMKDIITVAREAMLRLIALAQGENVATWGFEGESDLEECFTDIRLGEFAIDYAKSLRNQCRNDSEDYEYWTAVLNELDWQQSRRTREGKPLPCCMVGKHPARIPDLTDWKRTIADISSGEKEQTNLLETNPDSDPSTETPLPERKLPPLEALVSRKPDGISMEALSIKIEEALAEASREASQTLPPLFDGLDRDGKLLMLRLLLAKKMGKEKTIMLAWGVKSGGRSHDKYRMASELIDSMMRDLSELGFDEDNNWGIEQ